MSNERVYYSHDTEVRAMRDRTAIALVFLVFGLGIGAGSALLLAPTSGKKTRNELNHALGQGLKDSRERVKPMVEQVEEEFSELKTNIEKRLK